MFPAAGNEEMKPQLLLSEGDCTATENGSDSEGGCVASETVLPLASEGGGLAMERAVE